MKKKFLKSVLTLVLLTFTSLFIKAQDPIRKTKKRTLHSLIVEKRTNYTKRKEDKKKWKDDREVTAVTEKNIKEHHKRLQTKQTRKNMRELKKKSKRTRY